MIKKRKFKFEAMKGLVDIYLDGKKVREEHNGETGHIYFPILESEEPEVDVAEHDSRIGIEVEIKDGKVVPFKIVPVFNKPKEIEKSHTCDNDKSPLLVDKAVKRGFRSGSSEDPNLGAKKAESDY